MDTTQEINFPALTSRTLLELFWRDRLEFLLDSNEILEVL